MTAVSTAVVAGSARHINVVDMSDLSIMLIYVKIRHLSACWVFCEQGIRSVAVYESTSIWSLDNI